MGKTDGLVSIDVQTEEGRSGFERACGFIAAIATHQALAITAEAMRINGQQFCSEMAAGPPQPSQSLLQGFGLSHRMGLEQIMDGWVGGDKGKAMEQFKSFLAQAARLAHTGDTQGGLVNQLQGQTGFDPGGGLAAPADQ